jgi:hypothetical protein
VKSAGDCGLLYCLAKKGVCSLVVGNVFFATEGEMKLGYVRWSRPVGWTGVCKLSEPTASDRGSSFRIK